MAIDISMIILTFNEEQHLPRLLDSIGTLGAPIYVLDSGSTDATLEICKQRGVVIAHHPFENHPKQWNVALNIFTIKTPWVIGLDADHILTPALHKKLSDFKNDDYLDIDGIYFNRINVYKGKWIKHGGHYPKYQLKMFRYLRGHSDLSENMDHRFQVPGKTIIWKNEQLIEENLKEASIAFWISKHNRYSDLLATEEIERIHQTRSQQLNPAFWGSPNEHNAWLKRLWWKLPRYIRPILYICYRLFIQRGILDGKTGIIYHFMQGFWFRLIVDIKIDEKLKMAAHQKSSLKITVQPIRNQYSRFLWGFPTLALIFYGFNLAFIGLTAPGGYYVEFFDKNMNYITSWRNFNISAVAELLQLMGENVTTGTHRLHVDGKAGFKIVYSCLGYGILSIFSAFVLMYPKSLPKKILFLIIGILIFQCLNITRLMMISLYWHHTLMVFKVHAHDIFSLLVYAIMGFATYLYLYSKPRKN